MAFDSWFAEEISVAAAAPRGRPGCPCFSAALRPDSRTPRFGHGFIDLPVNVQEAVVEARSLARGPGLPDDRRWRGCGEHDLSGVVERFNDANPERARAHLPELPYHGIWCAVADPSVSGGHADSSTTSIAMDRHPELVRLGEVPSEVSEQPDWSSTHQDFTKVSTTGVVGDATHASAELGARLWDACATSIASTFATIAAARSHDEARHVLDEPRREGRRELRTARHRRDAGLFPVEGFGEIKRALEGGIEIEQMWSCPELFLGENEEDLVDEAERLGAEIIEVTRKPFEKMSYRDRPEGLLAVCSFYDTSIESIDLSDRPSSWSSSRSRSPGISGR